MPTNYTGRLTLILVVLLGALWLIFPSPTKLFDSSLPLSEKMNLHPGIDMVGGTSLLYEIKAPEHSTANNNLAEQVMESLKKRVDPLGQRNLVWRPQGNTRLEIQMPLSAKNDKAKDKRAAFDAAQRKLSDTNVRLDEVTDAIEKMTGDARRARIDQLAMGSQKRATIFGAMASTWDQMQAAQKAKNFSLVADKQDDYDKLRGEVESTNIDVTDLSQKLDSTGDDAGKQKDVIEAAKAVTPNFPQRLTALDAFAAAYKDYKSVSASIDSAADLKNLLRGSGVLEYHILITDPTLPEVAAMRDRLARSGPRPQARDTMEWVLADQPEEFEHRPEFVTATYNGKLYVLVSTQPNQEMINGEGIKRWALERAFPTSDQYGATIVGFEFDPQGAQYFSELTRININKPLGIVLDDKLISAPLIHSQIGKSGTIDGGSKGFSPSDLNYLINTLNAGSLPAQLADEPISERTVGPQLGADNLRAGLHSCLYGLVVVGVFLIAYYYIAGIVAFFAVLMNLVLILGVMAMLNATFTLPGVAGIVLTIGAAVDANVLIFERLREEQQRGLSLRMAMRNAYDRAFSAIVDSNMTTVITSLVLCWIGSEEVKGFGITLLIGLISSLFTALFVTKTIFGILIDKFGVTNLNSLPLTFPKWDKLLHPNIDWMAKWPYFVVCSLLFMVVGGWSFFHYFGKNEILDIEFAGGTSVQFQMKQPMKLEAVRSMIAAIGEAKLPSPSVFGVNNPGETPGTTYEIDTPNTNSNEVKDAVVSKFGTLLNIELKSNFDGVGQKFDEVMNNLVVPINDDTMQVAGITLNNQGAFRGGAAIVLRNLQPPLSGDEIRSRIGRARLQAQVNSDMARYRDVSVQTNAGTSDAPASTAIVLTSDPDIHYKEDPARWRDEIAAPMWKLINDAVNNPPQLQKVNNFDAQVAGDTQKEAYGALGLSLIVIMAYIWLRFGNLQFGTATVLAMIHDTFLAIAAIGLAHLAVEYAPPVASGLMLEPFRLNLTLVAAILTIMSYSMIDTIVVFDRIRENRGKFGHLDRQVINDSINQTLSRTLLTAGTTIVTVTVMYVVGGPGIHGFTFVLLFGILVGTYSSIAIAAPILLLSRKATSNPTSLPPGRREAGQLQRA